jgi:hypothetical protein
MWQILNGTVVNTAAVLAGSSCGLLLGPRLAERYSRIVLSGLGLVTLGLGFDAALLEFHAAVERYRTAFNAGPAFGAHLALVVVASLLIGGLLGTWFRLHERIEALGGWLHHRFAGRSESQVAQGFLTAGVIFCVGPLTLLGCLANGARSDPSLLYIKSLLDGFCSIALSATLGVGVLFSAVAVLGFQGALSLAAHFLAGEEPTLGFALMSCVGGYILLGVGLLLLEIKSLPVANYLPGIFLPPVIVPLVARMGWLDAS